MGEVSLIDVSKNFTLRVDGDVQNVQALDRLSFTVRDGEVVALIGPSGCGKTTALRIAMGLEAASGGRVTVSIHQSPAASGANMKRRRMTPRRCRTRATGCSRRSPPMSRAPIST